MHHIFKKKKKAKALANLNTFFSMDEEVGMTDTNFGSENVPQVVFSLIVGRPKQKICQDKKKMYIGDGANKRNILGLMVKKKKVKTK
ncbi:hypothetical protein RFI_16361 [Reticulomyxa filosa]|uniref:Uncharacterized protein n=1 Tax=Reticulomyxa filosa TaxID=46433 RepID=X6N6C7_RETFI|nr:hypothetical protein RFI_16361 [Reticulomyxa filosa]|eukprot:ETO20847.1 hypothetical protein RFI_16361 [Reticulomyxa filosa]